MNKILLIEDNNDTQELVRHSLKGFCELFIASTATQAYFNIENNLYDLILLDINLPDGNGFEICHQLMTNEKTKSIPIIFLTAQNASEDIIKAYQLGAEDYIIKPFDPRVLKVKIEAKFKQAQNNFENSKWIKKKELRLNTHTQKAYIDTNHHSEELNLTPTEYRLLYTFITHEDKILTRSILMNHVWNHETHVTDRVIDIHISSLRKKIGPIGPLIRTVYGSGYLFSTEPKKREKKVS